jgi:alpha-L-arabinofuranosidase
LNGGGPTYGEYRFNAFFDAITAAYPNLTIISSFYDVDDFGEPGQPKGTPPFNASGDFHEYAIPVQMSSQFGFFDNYTSAHPLLLGEYAVVEYDQPGTNQPSWTTGA